MSSVPNEAPLLSCEEVAAMLFEYVEGELDDHQHALVEAHLSLCPHCESFVRSYASVGGLVRAALEVTVDKHLQDELDAAIFAAIRASA